MFYYIGIGACFLGATNLLKLALGLLNNSDSATALTFRAPKSAFADKVVWITGASSGIGKEMVLHLVRNGGCRLIISSRRHGVLAKLRHECMKLAPGIEIEIVVLDLASSIEELQGKAKAAINAFGGRIDVMINCAGVSSRTFARDSSPYTEPYIAQVDYLAHVALTKAVLPTFESQSEACIINVGSVVSRVAAPARSGYVAAKHALYGFMKSLHVETRLTGNSHIHILDIILGSTKTALPTKAVVDVTKDGKVITLGEGTVDPNIENGMDPSWVAERILSVAHGRKIHETWLAPPKELLVLSLAQYIPQTALGILTKALAKQYAVRKSPESSSSPTTESKKDS